MTPSDSRAESELLSGQEPISRRDFLSSVISLGLWVTLASIIIPALSYLWPSTKRGPVGGLSDVGGVDEFPFWGSKKVILGGSAILVVRTDQEFKAFSAICTHLGCLVAWD